MSVAQSVALGEASRSLKRRVEASFLNKNMVADRGGFDRPSVAGVRIGARMLAQGGNGRAGQPTAVS